MVEKVTIDKIIERLSGWVEDRTPIAPSVWIDAALQMTVLLGDEQNKIVDLQQTAAKLKVSLIEKGDTVAKANAIVEASDEYRELKRMEAKLTQVEELVRLAKVQARMADSELRMG